MIYKPTTALNKILRLNKRIRAVSGGTGASKTVSILTWLMDYAQTRKGKVVSVVSESYPHLSLGAIREFKAIMLDRGYWNDTLWNDSQHTYTFETGTIIEFISMDKLGKAHGPRRDVLFINEANNLEWQIVDQLITRTKEIVWMDWNPTSEFYFYTEMLGKRDDIEFMGDGGHFPPLTFEDNEGLDDGQKQEILSHRNNLRWWQVYGLGKMGDIEGRIYTGWRIDLDQIPFEARLERYGLDFGYTNDPTAIVAIWYYNGGYILDEIAFQKGLSNKQIADILLNQEKKALVIADSAEPKSIDELRLFGVNVMPAQKGKDSVTSGIQMVQDQQISVTKRSVNLIKEYRNYLWETDKDGRIINVPEHIWSHSMDAIRYGISSLVPIIRAKEMFDLMPQYERHVKPNPAR